MLPIFYISSDAIDVDVTKDLTRYSRMVNADIFTELSANVDCIAWDIDTDADDVDTCHEQFFNKFTQVYE